MEVAETASGVCLLATGAGSRKIIGARPETDWLAVAEVVYAILLKELALYFSEYIEHS